MKEAFYFSHDSNARHDPKILSMRSVYGSEGYGWYWIIIEMLREQEEYKIELSKYVWNALAMQMQCDADAVHNFVNDCINEFGLLHSDGEYFWSQSLNKRMKMKNEKSEKAKKAAEARWSKRSNSKGSKQPQNESNANAMQPHSEGNAIKESKRKESKEKESKDVVVKGKPTAPNPFNFYEQNGFGTLSSKTSDDMNYWIDGSFFEQPEDILIQAMKEAVDNNVRTWRYCDTILINWNNKGLKSLKDVEAYLKQFNSKTNKPDKPQYPKGEEDSAKRNDKHSSELGNVRLYK